MAKKPVSNVEALIGGDVPAIEPVMVMVRWMAHGRSTVEGKPRYKDDQFYMPRSDVGQYGKKVQIV